MNGLDKILAYIKSVSDTQCAEIHRNAAEECRLIHDEYSRLEQEEYWKFINASSKDLENRREQLKSLAEMESKKKLLSTQQEMVDEAFALAAKKLLELPRRDYTALLRKLNINTASRADEVVEHFRKELSLKVLSALFE